ncbi:MAG: FAD-binding oxidoreductase, partial [Pseudomonadota bacterium]
MNDYLVIGGGISGAAAAFELAAHGATVLVEAEGAPGYHSTGRSAALYTRHFGGPIVRRINSASATFFTDPPEGFSDHPLLTPRGGLTIAAPGEEDALAAMLARTADESGEDHGIVAITPDEAFRRAPLLRRERVGAALYEEGIQDIEVASLHQGYLRAFKARGGRLVCDRRIEHLARDSGGWQARAGDETLTARIVVNAAGAWAGHIGAMAGAADIGLVPKRRTGILLDAPPGLDVGAMPAVDYLSTDAYWKPDAGKIMASPGDATPIEPQDAQPDEYDVAVLAAWMEAETTLTVRRIAHSWAGLRSFVADEAPVLGFDGSAEGFFWLAGQGGYGIMMAPALARATAS